MKTVRESIEINASAKVVFEHVDDIANTGWHMTKSSMPLMGSSLTLEILSKNPTGVGATYRWHGKIMGFTMDFSEIISRWVPNKERVWHTIGNPKILIMRAYEMRFMIKSLHERSRLTFEITYDLPKPIFWKCVGFLLSGPYSRWCLRNMCKDAKKALEKPL